MVVFTCIVCGRELNGKPYRLHRNTEVWDILDQGMDLMHPMVENAPYCNCCYEKLRRRIRARQRPIQQDPVPNNDELAIGAIPTSQQLCCVCGKTTGRRVISTVTAAVVWAEKNIYIPTNNRTCAEHVSNDVFTPYALDLLMERCVIKTIKHSDMLSRVQDFLKTYIKSPPRISSPPLDFDSPLLTNSDYECYTSLTKEQFDFILSFISPYMRDSQNRVLDLLTEHYVPRYHGFGHITRQELIENHRTQLSTTLCDLLEGGIAFIADGAYLECESSSNYAVQRDTYSGQKHYNLVKPMITCMPDGYIIAAKGLCHGRNNDASIIKYMLDESSEFSDFFQENDALIVDRGFQDCVALLEELGLNVHMPCLMRPGTTQFSSEDANLSRLVTKMRWVIESVNGRLKNRFKFLRNRIPNLYLNSLLQILHVACAILNCFFVPLERDKDGDLELANMMKERAGLANLLQERVERERYRLQRAVWTDLTSEEIADFPVLSENDLRSITLGIYQIKQTRSYVAIHTSNNEYKLQVHRQDAGLIHVKIESRFRANKVHHLWIDYWPNQIGYGGIRGTIVSCGNFPRFSYNTNVRYGVLRFMN
ncbi:unnamed protein product [Allacma fusca]|uniref:DDE Tnp4 domain-containing protein n=1 Tax=Allacma fusca TaxID=39272 RepID=A0A8J2KKT8_9HEXA|nr:unnamed protein product [Allacma fusca]